MAKKASLYLIHWLNSNDVTYHLAGVSADALTQHHKDSDPRSYATVATAPGETFEEAMRNLARSISVANLIKAGKLDGLREIATLREALETFESELGV